RSSLHSALESEVGTVLGGRRGRALPQVIEKRLSALVTSTGRPRGAYRELIDQVVSLKDALEDLRVRRRELSETLDDLDAAQERLRRLETGERDAADREEVEEARKRHRELAALETRIQGARSELELRTRDFDQLVKVRDERAGLLKQTEKADEQARLAGEQLSETLQQETEARSRLGELRDGQRDAEAAVTAADDAVSYRRRVADAVERQERIRELQSRQNKAEAAEARA